MIALLSGSVAALAADHAVIDVQGVGYLVHASTRTLSRLAPDQAARLLIETQVREESVTLFGFLEPAERDWFRLLLGVQGVGGRLALALLSTLEPRELSRALATGDRAMIARTPGVGPRLAARLVTELKGAAPEAGEQIAAGPSPAAATREALSSLANLGFRGSEAAEAVAAAEAALGDGADTSALIREALQRARRV